jgi:glutathione S-transferase
VYGVDRRRAERRLARTRAALDRLVEEIGPHGYLVGGRFTVADLTAAALGRLLAPPDYAHPVATASPALQEVRDSMRDHPAVDWIEAMYVRHRDPRSFASSEQAAQKTPAPA